jgi:uncharacterized protein YukE
MIFRNGAGKLVDPTSVEVYIFDQGSNPDSEEVAIEDAFAYLEPVKVQKGKYYIDYVFPTDADPGDWYILWLGNNSKAVFKKLDKVEVLYNSEISGLPEAPTDGYGIVGNTLYTLEISGVMSVTGEVLASTSMWFTSKYSPMYSSYQNILALLKEFVGGLKVDPTNFLIWKFSQEADEITMPRCVLDESYLRLAKKKYVEYATVINLLENFSTTPSSLRSKQLGDLKVAYGDNQLGLKDAIKKFSNEMEEWERVLNSGGTRVKGASIGMRVATIGIQHPDRPIIGRDPGPNNRYEVLANTQEVRPGGQRMIGAYKKPMTEQPWNVRDTGYRNEPR